ncbi:MAG: ATP-dependent DNA helicase [Bacteroidia bacterium]|nr:MAG: ATP-dependent DNA helicase [Bacteroidia bacterium]
MEDYIKSLNPAQREAVLTLEGPMLIVAGAGSGKTRVLTYRIAHMIEQGVRPWNILALTFTNKAAREMQTRIAGVVGQEVARSIWMNTFHSVFLRILRREAEHTDFTSSFSIYDTSTARTLLSRLIKEDGLEGNAYKPAAIAARISMAKNQLIFPQTYCTDERIQLQDRMAKRPETGRIYERYMDALRKANAMDFDDILVRTYILFAHHPDVLEKYREQFKRILVDEYQDTNTVQDKILYQLAGAHQNLCVVGDDAQSIYAFRGAKIQNILGFPTLYPGVKTIKLETNYRSTASIVGAANQLIAHNPHQIPKSCVAATSGGEGIQIKSCFTDITEAYTVAQDILRTALAEQSGYDQFAILYRTNTQSRQLEIALREKNIPYQIYAGKSFYERREIVDTLSYFRLVINPDDNEALLRVINVPARGIGATTLGHLEAAAKARGCSLWRLLETAEQEGLPIRSGTLGALCRFRDAVAPFIGRALGEEALTVAQELLEAVDLKSAYSNETQAENQTRLDNIDELLSNIDEAAVSTVERGDAEMMTLAMFMDEVSLLSDTDVDEEADRRRVTLTTVHSSKGLEFDHVYIVGLEEGIFPSERSLREASGLEEERRLCYVAVTRAAKRLMLTHAAQRRAFGKTVQNAPSRFLSEIRPGYLQQLASEQRSTGLEGTSGGGGYAPSIRPRGINRPQPKAPPAHQIDPAAITPIDQLQAGDRVLHARFGRGHIEQLQGEGQDVKAIVQFDVSGTRTLLLKFAKLQKL